jgi:two-component system response regulator MtrA
VAGTTSCSSTATSPRIAAYGAARLQQGVCGEFVAWVQALEIERFGSPSPTGTCSLDVPRAVAAQRAAPPGAHGARAAPRPLRVRRGAPGPDREVYRGLAAAGLAGPWTVLDGAADLDGTDPGHAGLAHDLAGLGRPRTRDKQGVSRTVGGGWDIACMKSRVLVVDDDPALAEMLTIVLRGEGFDTAVVGDGTRALPAVRDLRPDVVLLDLMLPGMNGIDVCRAIRTESGVPIVMLTAKTDTVDIVLGLESGADDYVVKPFKPKELVARIRARVRRTDAEPAEQLSIGDVTIDVPAHQVRAQRRADRADAPGVRPAGGAGRKPRQVFTREVLLEQVWGYRHAADTRLVNVHVQRLRSKVERDPEHPEVVLTVRGVGYKAGPP